MQEDLHEFPARIEAFEIDPGDKTLGFANRLARENRWSVTFAQRVIREYKRFCVLAMRSGHPVTPSEQVDQAWHLHLTYTRSYRTVFAAVRSVHRYIMSRRQVELVRVPSSMIGTLRHFGVTSRYSAIDRRRTSGLRRKNVLHMPANGSGSTSVGMG